MATVRWTPTAFSSLLAILRYHAEYSPHQAEKVQQAVLKAVSRLETFPELGPAKVKTLRCLAIPHYPYSCWYRAQGDTVAILLIKHNRRQNEPGFE